MKKFQINFSKIFFKAFLIFLAASILAGGTCVAGLKKTSSSACITEFDNGYIDWSTGNIVAVGKASPEDNPANSYSSVPGAARTDANRQLIEILKQIKINNILSVSGYASANDMILAGMEKTARDAKILKQYYTSALAVEIRIEASIYGGFLQLILPEEIRQISRINPENIKKNTKVLYENPFTGLIIDAKGLGVTPVLNPTIISEQGHSVYSSVFISREFAVQNGVCKYVCDKEAALKDGRIGVHPLVLKGLRKEGKENSSIAISMSDYHLLEKIAERHTFLKECRVVIIID